MTWQRARSDEQKEQRILELIQAAAKLYEATPIAEITIATIAREAGWTRSNIYKYFSTKEEVFLELLQNDVSAWRDDVEALCAEWSGSVAEFSVAWTALHEKHERMVELMAVLFSVLERNCSVEKLTAFKRALLGEMACVGSALAGALPFRDGQAIAEFVQASSSLLIGTAPLWRPTEKQLAAMDAAEYPHDVVQIKRMYRQATEVLLQAAISD